MATTYISTKYTPSEIEKKGLLLIDGTEIDDDLKQSGDDWGGELI